MPPGRAEIRFLGQEKVEFNEGMNPFLISTSMQRRRGSNAESKFNAAYRENPCHWKVFLASSSHLRSRPLTHRSSSSRSYYSSSEILLLILGFSLLVSLFIFAVVAAIVVAVIVAVIIVVVTVIVFARPLDFFVSLSVSF